MSTNTRSSVATHLYWSAHLPASLSPNPESVPPIHMSFNPCIGGMSSYRMDPAKSMRKARHPTNTASFEVGLVPHPAYHARRGIPLVNPSRGNQEIWRNEMDSNHRHLFRCTPLAGERFQPTQPSFRYRVTVATPFKASLNCKRASEAQTKNPEQVRVYR